MPTQIADLWTPAVWLEEVREQQATFPALFNSKAIIRTAEIQKVAEGPGTSANIPFFKDITDQGDEIQVENTAPKSDNVQPSGLQVCVPLNRVTKNSASALSAQVSGSDPVGSMVGQLLARRYKQRQTTLISILRGCFGTGSQARNAAAPLSAVRLGGTAAETFHESIATQVASDKISPDMFINAKALMGELADELSSGVFFCHPDIQAALEKLDASSFKNGVQSGLPFSVKTYRDVPIFTSAALSRGGTTDGTVYDNYLIGTGVIGYGDKAQQGDTIDVASLSYFADKDKNNEIIYDRTRCVIHLNGMKWVGAPAGQSATNAELGTVGNWNLVLSSANRVGAVAFRCNG